MRLALAALAVFALPAALAFTAPPALRAQEARSAQVSEGAALYVQHCALCHGADGRRGQGFQTPIWGAQTQIGKFANAHGLFEYNQMMMPFDDPTKLTDEQKMAITAYMLVQHGAMPGSATLSAANAPGIAIR